MEQFPDDPRKYIKKVSLMETATRMRFIGSKMQLC